MSAIAVISEFNPLHSGHKRILDEARKHGTVICILSGNFVQRGDTAILDKRIRALSALSCGADMVIELPVLWSMSTAQNFALGGVFAAKAAGCERLIFGSECGDINPLKAAADITLSAEFSAKLKAKLSSGVTFAAARQSAAEECGADKGIFDGSNNALGIEYILAAKRTCAELDFLTVKRYGSGHDSKEISETVSASLLREKILSGDLGFCKPFMPKESYDNLISSPVSDISRLDTAILANLRTLPPEHFARLPDISEGLQNKIYSAIRVATDLNDLYNRIKVKRYTLARIRRLVLSAFLGFDGEFFLQPLPYLRVLGMNKNGEKYLKDTLSASDTPVVLRPSDIETLSEKAKKVFKTECRATDMYALSLSKPTACGLEYTAKLIKTE